MKVFISVDIEGVNGTCCWDDTEYGDPRYSEFKKELERELAAAIRGAKKAGATEIVVRDAHDSARNLSIDSINVDGTLIRGWEGGVAAMMTGLTKDFDCVMFVGYHSPSRSLGNPLSHTWNTTRVHHVKFNGEIISEFYMNALFATYLNVPIAFLSGDENLCNLVNKENPNIQTCVTKQSIYGAVVCKHPEQLEKEIEEKSFNAIKNVSMNNIVKMPKEFDIEIEYVKPLMAYSASFFPGCKLIDSDRISYHCTNYYDALVMLKFLL